MNLNATRVSEPPEELRTLVAVFVLSALCFAMFVFLSACDTAMEVQAQRHEVEQFRIHTEKIVGQRLLASGVIFQAQQAGTVRHRITADTISTAPRGFGAFNVNGINELLIENAHIEIFPPVQEDTDGENDDGRVIDFSDTLRKYFDSLPGEFGMISRLRISKVHITLHGVGKDGAAVNVIARELLKDFDGDAEPELYSVRFYDAQSEAGLDVRRVRWNTQKGQFIIKAADSSTIELISS